MTLSACDCQRKSKCEWYIEPDLDNKKYASEGFVTVCVKNYELGKQKCFLELPLEEAKRVYQKRVTYQSLEIDHTVMPRRIKRFQICQTK